MSVARLGMTASHESGIIPCQFNQFQNTFAPSDLELPGKKILSVVYQFNETLPNFMRISQKIDRVTSFQSDRGRRKFGSDSRHVLRGHIESGITLEVRQIETWGLHWCVQKVICC